MLCKLANSVGRKILLIRKRIYTLLLSYLFSLHLPSTRADNSKSMNKIASVMVKMLWFKGCYKPLPMLSGSVSYEWRNIKEAALSFVHNWGEKFLVAESFANVLQKFVFMFNNRLRMNTRRALPMCLVTSKTLHEWVMMVRRC